MTLRVNKTSLLVSLVRAAVTLLAAVLSLSSYGQGPPESPPQSQQDGSRDLKPVHPDDKGGLSSNAVPQSYALVVGIAHYANLPDSAQLRYPDRDAQSIYTTPISQQGGQFPANHVHMLTGPQATQAGILHELDVWLPSVAAPNDRVLVYFAGHGSISGGKGFLAPYDIDLHNIAGTAIAMERLGSLIGTKIKGKWKVLLTDACHSGAITPETNPVRKFIGSYDAVAIRIRSARHSAHDVVSENATPVPGIWVKVVEELATRTKPQAPRSLRCCLASSFEAGIG